MDDNRSYSSHTFLDIPVTLSKIFYWSNWLPCRQSRPRFMTLTVLDAKQAEEIKEYNYLVQQSFGQCKDLIFWVLLYIFRFYCYPFLSPIYPLNLILLTGIPISFYGFVLQITWTNACTYFHFLNILALLKRSWSCLINMDMIYAVFHHFFFYLKHSVISLALSKMLVSYPNEYNIDVEINQGCCHPSATYFIEWH